MIRWNTKLVEEFITNIGGYELLSEYTPKRKITLLHLECKSEFNVNFQHFKSGTRCPVCNQNIKKTNDLFLLEVKNKYPSDEYEFLEEYNGNSKKIKVRHVCGYEYSVTPKNFLINDRKCPKCSKVPRKNTDYFLQEISSKYPDVFDYIVIESEYVKYNVNLEILCLKCYKVFKRTPDNLLRQGYECPMCKGSVSKPILDLISLMETQHIQYTLEKRYKECKRIYTLPFDIFLTDYNVLIEYDGEQHTTGYRKSQDSLNYIQENDSIKTNFCIENDIPLYRISHLENHKERFKEILKEVQRLSREGVHSSEWKCKESH